MSAPTVTMDKINPGDCQVLSLGNSELLQHFRVVSSDYGKPRTNIAVPIRHQIPMNQPFHYASTNADGLHICSGLGLLTKSIGLEYILGGSPRNLQQDPRFTPKKLRLYQLRGPLVRSH